MTPSSSEYEIVGYKVAVIVAGFFGGVISMAFNPNMSALMRYLSVFSGVCCAMFFTPVVLHLWDWFIPFEPAIAFILGIGGMAIVGKIHTLFQKIDLMQLLKSWITNSDKTPKGR